MGVGQTALAEDISDGFTLLQRMVAIWQKKRWLVPSLQELSKVWNGSKSNTIGVGGYFNTPRPNKISAAWFVQGNTGGNPVSIQLKPLFSFEDYALIAVKDLQTVPSKFFYDGHFPLGNLYIHPIPSAQYTVHIIIEDQLGFETTIETGEIEAGGAGYVTANYVAVPLTGGSGSGATADIVVTAGVVAIVTLLDGGEGYAVDDVLSASNANLGGVGAGFQWKVDTVTANLDSEILMPPEYEEALYYNLAIRLASMYQLPANPDTKSLAKAALNTLRVANTQIPRLIMPPGLRRGPAFNIFNADGY